MSTNFILLALDSFTKARNVIKEDDHLASTAATLALEIKKNGMTPDLLDLTLAFFMQRLAVVQD